MNICQKKEEHGGKAFIYMHSVNKLLSFTKRNQKKLFTLITGSSVKYYVN